MLPTILEIDPGVAVATIAQRICANPPSSDELIRKSDLFAWGGFQAVPDYGRAKTHADASYRYMQISEDLRAVLIAKLARYLRNEPAEGYRLLDVGDTLEYVEERGDKKALKYALWGQKQLRAGLKGGQLDPEQRAVAQAAMGRLGKVAQLARGFLTYEPTHLKSTEI